MHQYALQSPGSGVKVCLAWLMFHHIPCFIIDCCVIDPNLIWAS